MEPPERNERVCEGLSDTDSDSNDKSGLKHGEKVKVEKPEKSALGIDIRYSIFDIRVKVGRLKVENIFT